MTTMIFLLYLINKILNQMIRNFSLNCDYRVEVNEVNNKKKFSQKLH